MNTEIVNHQIVTRWADSSKQRLVTSLEQKPTPSLSAGEILVRMRHVPLHGSFWLASHPDAIHPRRDEFMANGRFVFGNGGVGEVIASKDDKRHVKPGDFVCIFGHLPCDRYNCYACGVLHRYTECEYNESSIIGHGKHAPDGTYAEYVTLRRHAYEVCYRKEEAPKDEDLIAFMLGFLVADVRNALTRHPDSLRMRRMLLIGAGFSGHIGAYLHTRSSPETKVLAIDSSVDRIESIRALAPDSIETLLVPDDIAKLMSARGKRPSEDALLPFIKSIEETIEHHFRGRKCNLLLDCSSGNTTPLWVNRNILGPTAHCILFGFGSSELTLNQPLMQCSGLTFMMSRGVGNIRNRKEVIELIKAGGCNAIRNHLIRHSRALTSLESAIQFIHEMQSPPRPLYQIEPAYISLL